MLLSLVLRSTISFLAMCALCAAEKRAHFSTRDLYGLQSTIWHNFISPNNAIQAASINSSLFDENVRGRVDVTREFIGAELNTEYFFGLFAQLQTSQSFTLLGIPVSYEIVHFTGNQDIASSATLVNFNSSLWGPFTLEIHAWNKFNVRGKLQQYEVTFRNWNLFVGENLQRLAAQKFGGSVPNTVSYVADQLANTICQIHDQYCTRENKQYQDSATCHRFLTAEIPFGEGHEMGRNTLLCRMAHYPMVPLRPNVHCGHIGPDGGGMCDNKESYSDRISQAFWQHTWMPQELE